MPILLAILLGLVQALTEFLPVSSSGHLVLFQIYFEPIFGVGRTPLSFDVFVHLATLLVTVIFLRQDLLHILGKFFLSSDESKRAKSLVLLTIVGSLPAAVVGLGFSELIEEYFSSTSVVANGFLITCVFLASAHFRQKRYMNSIADDSGAMDNNSWELPSMTQALIIGVAQAMAILPGVSRSGSTIATALLLGVHTETAIRFSFLLAIPAILGATVLHLDALMSLSTSDMTSYMLGFIMTFSAGWFAIRWLVAVTRKSRLLYFALYTLVLSLLLRF